MDFIAADIIANGHTYDQYRSMITGLLAEGKTTGPIQTPVMVEYTELNNKRMKRLDKTFKPSAEASALLEQIDQPLLWLVITEAWCGDAGQIIPVLNGLAQLSPNIDLRLILRDEHLDVMDAFLTNGGRSIPKVIVVEPETRRVLGSWGPRPAGVQEIMMATKADMKALEHDKLARKARYEDGQRIVHSWYAKDRTVSTQREVLETVVNHLEKAALSEVA